jgi:hypothetical protein
VFNPNGFDWFSGSYMYSGAYYKPGYPQYFTITPYIASCGNGSLTFTLYGAGGGTAWTDNSNYSIANGGPGGLTTGVISISDLMNTYQTNVLTIMVGTGGSDDDVPPRLNFYSGAGWYGGGDAGSGGPDTAGAGGGGTFVCAGAYTICNSQNMLLAAGGGGGSGTLSGGPGGSGGGGNNVGTCPQFPSDYGNLQECLSNCYNNYSTGCVFYGFTADRWWCNVQQYCISACYTLTGSFMHGGNGEYAITNGVNGNLGVGGGGGGSGYNGGNGGWGGYSGCGGSGYCSSIVKNCGGITGGANNGGIAIPGEWGAPGGNGQVIISW